MPSDDSSTNELPDAGWSRRLDPVPSALSTGLPPRVFCDVCVAYRFILRVEANGDHVLVVVDCGHTLGCEKIEWLKVDNIAVMTGKVQPRGLRA